MGLQFTQHNLNRLSILILTSILLQAAQWSLAEEVCSQVEKADLVLVIDSSGSIKKSAPIDDPDQNWRFALDFLVKVVENVNVAEDGWRVGMIVFGNEAINHFYLNSHFDRSAIISSIQNTMYLDENTNTYSALQLARTEQFTRERGDREGVPNVIIIVTDGVSTFNNESTVPEAERCHGAGIDIFSVGVSDEIDEVELRLISSPPRMEDRNWFTTPTFDTLNQIVDQITDETCMRIEEKECPVCTPHLENEGFWKLFAIIAAIVAGIAILGAASCGIIALSLSKKLSKSKKNADRF